MHPPNQLRLIPRQPTPQNQLIHTHTLARQLLRQGIRLWRSGWNRHMRSMTLKMSLDGFKAAFQTTEHHHQHRSRNIRARCGKTLRQLDAQSQLLTPHPIKQHPLCRHQQDQRDQANLNTHTQSPCAAPCGKRHSLRTSSSATKPCFQGTTPRTGSSVRWARPDGGAAMSASFKDSSSSTASTRTPT